MKEYLQVELDPNDFVIYSPAKVESGENLKSIVVDPVNLEGKSPTSKVVRYKGVSTCKSFKRKLDFSFIL